MTKKKILIGSGILSIGLIAFDYIGTYYWCDYFLESGSQGSCPFILSDIEVLFLPFLPLFIFSLITYFMREEIFRAWWRFARIATPISIVLILLAPSYSSDWMLPIEKGAVALFTALIFIFVSTVVIIRARRRSK